MRLAAWFGVWPLAEFRKQITPYQLDRWIETGITSWPELLANGFTAVARAGGLKIRSDELRHWEPPEIVSEEVMIARVNQTYDVT